MLIKFKIQWTWTKCPLVCNCTNTQRGASGCWRSGNCLDMPWRAQNFEFVNSKSWNVYRIYGVQYSLILPQTSHIFQNLSYESWRCVHLFLRKMVDVTGFKWVAEIQFQKIDEIKPEADVKRESLGKFCDCNGKAYFYARHGPVEKVQRQRIKSSSKYKCVV